MEVNYWLFPGTTININNIVNVVVADYGITAEDISRDTRIQHIVEPRQICMFFAVKYLNMTQKNAGLMFAKRDHASAFHAVKCVTNRYQTDRSFRARLLGIVDRIGIRPSEIEKHLV